MTDTMIFSELSDEALKSYRDRMWREFHCCDAELERRKQKPITPLDREASLKVCRSIGRNISHRAWQKKDKWKVGG